MSIVSKKQDQSVVFVYGTLLRGEANHHFLRKQAFLGEHVTEAVFNLYDTGPYPAATATGCSVLKGELYGVDANCMARLDKLEDYPLLYTRQQISSPAGPAWIYLWIEDIRPDWPLIDGDWRGRLR